MPQLVPGAKCVDDSQKALQGLGICWQGEGLGFGVARGSTGQGTVWPSKFELQNLENDRGSLANFVHQMKLAKQGSRMWGA